MTESEQRHFEVLLEQVLHEVRTVAEGHSMPDSKLLTPKDRGNRYTNGMDRPAPLTASQCARMEVFQSKKERDSHEK